MDLPTGIQELLCDEAYVCLCREAVQEQLSAVEQQKVTLAKSRSPFGVLRRKATVEAFDRSMLEATTTEGGLRKRLEQLARFDTWLQQRLRTDLNAYLGLAGTDYRRLAELLQLFNHWDDWVRKPLREALVEFAREMRELRQAATEKNATHEACLPRLRSLRAVTLQLEERDCGLAQISASITNILQIVAHHELRLPPLPAFRRVLWVDWLSVIPLEQLTGELTRVEAEVGLVLRSSIDNALALTKASREWCARLQDNLLLNYWGQLRTHAQTYYVQECDVDDVLLVLANRYDPEITRRQVEATQNPCPSPPSPRGLSPEAINQQQGVA